MKQKLFTSKITIYIYNMIRKHFMKEMPVPLAVAVAGSIIGKTVSRKIA